MDMIRETRSLYLIEINSLDVFPSDNELQFRELKIKYALVYTACPHLSILCLYYSIWFILTLSHS